MNAPDPTPSLRRPTQAGDGDFSGGAKGTAGDRRANAQSSKTAPRLRLSMSRPKTTEPMTKTQTRPAIFL